MDNTIKKYIDGIIHAFSYEIKHNTGYTLYVDDLSDYQQNLAIQFLLNNSKPAREILLDRLQTLINERLDIVYAEDKRNQGLVPAMDKVNGEITWRVS